MSETFAGLQQRIGYHFTEAGLLQQALTHSSYINEHRMSRYESNERLEYLGDAVLELVSSHMLYMAYPEEPEGSLSRMRANLVCEPALGTRARRIGLGPLLMMGRGESMNGGRERDSILSDALEALIGAIYLDGGFECARTFVLEYVLDDPEKSNYLRDSKTALQELVQLHLHQTVSYQLISESGPEHQRIFKVLASLDGQALASGTGRTKQAAGQDAAARSLDLIAAHPELLEKKNRP